MRFFPSTVRNDMNAVVAALNYGGVDNMEGEDPPPAASNRKIVGGISIIQSNLHKLVMKGIHEPNEEFKNQVEAAEESRRITEAMAPGQLDTVASRITAVYIAKRPVMAPVLGEVVREVTAIAYSVDDLNRQVQCIMSQMDGLPGNCRRGQGRGSGCNAKPTP